MKDRVFARMLEIVLLENNVSSEVTDTSRAKIPEDTLLVITDTECGIGEADAFENTVFITKGSETPPAEKRSFHRPFLMDAFVSEINKLLFTEESADSPPTLTVDKKHKTAKYGRLSVSLTETELKLLLLLYENKGQTVLYSEIIQNVFGGRTAENSNVPAVYVNYLRKKLDEKFGKRLIFSVRGKGYTLKI
jgi:hypothetical protein